MKAYKVVLGIINFANIGEDEIKQIFETSRPSSVDILCIESREIGEWSDDHPLNLASTASAEWERIFETKG